MVDISISETYAAKAYEAITVAAAAIGITATLLKSTTNGSARSVFMTLETAQIRFRIDGTDPAANQGHLLEVGQTLTLTNPSDLKNFRAIRTGSTSGVLRVTVRY